MYRLYIGSNNEMKELELDKIKEIVSRYYDGFTIIIATGYWKGKEEKTAIVEIETNFLHDLMLSKLKSQLHQEAIGMQVLPSIEFL